MEGLTLLLIFLQLLNVDNRNIPFHQFEMNILNFGIFSTPQAKQNNNMMVTIKTQNFKYTDLVNNVSELFEVK